jgi:hypothetical protein
MFFFAFPGIQSKIQYKRLVKKIKNISKEARLKKNEANIRINLMISELEVNLKNKNISDEQKMNYVAEYLEEKEHFEIAIQNSKKILSVVNNQFSLIYERSTIDNFGLRELILRQHFVLPRLKNHLNNINSIFKKYK